MQDPDPKCRHFVISWHFMAFWHACQKANCITKSAFSAFFRLFHRIRLLDFSALETKLLISPLKIRIFCPTTTKFGPKLAFLFILGQALSAHLVPCWWVGWWFWCAGCISQDTYVLYVFLYVQQSAFLTCEQFVDPE